MYNCSKFEITNWKPTCIQGFWCHLIWGAYTYVHGKNYSKSLWYGENLMSEQLMLNLKSEVFARNLKLKIYIIVSKIIYWSHLREKASLSFSIVILILLVKPNRNEWANLETFVWKIISRNAIPYLTTNLCFSNLITKPSAGYCFLVTYNKKYSESISLPPYWASNYYLTFPITFTRFLQCLAPQQDGMKPWKGL